MIVDLVKNKPQEDIFLKCLKTWNSIVHPKKKEWLQKMADNLKVFLAENDDGEIVGMIQIIPIEYSN